MNLDWNAVPGFRWMENGQSVLHGPLLDLYRKLDAEFVQWGANWGAQEFSFPAFLPARELDRLDYFRSFPHLVTFPITLDPDEGNLDSFTRQPTENGILQLSGTAPVRDVLTPAACYHFYLQFEGEDFAFPAYVTTRASCFRREESYSPLQRQWCFSMREIVCIGTSQEVLLFLQSSRKTVEDFAKRIELPLQWQDATDPFFRPAANPKHVAQMLDPLKTEMVFENRLAIGSANFHRNYFGEAFRMTRSGEVAFSGCIAFGIERWIYAILTRHGIDPAAWPL